MRSIDAFGRGAAGRLERCDPKRFRLKEGGTSALSVLAGLESAKVGDAEGSCSRMLPFWRMFVAGSSSRGEGSRDLILEVS